MTVGLFALRGRVLAAAHRDEHPLTSDEAAAIAESAETCCRRWSAWQSDSIADVARLMAGRLCRSAPTFVRRGRACELQRHGQRWALRVQPGPGLTLREPVLEGQHYLVVNCDDHPLVRRIWMLWDAERRFFSRELGSPLRRFEPQPGTERHVEDVLPQARYRLARVSMVRVSVAAALIARRTCPSCGRQAGAVAAVDRMAVTVACRVCRHRWSSARGAGGADA